jgi:hypothetical protein
MRKWSIGCICVLIFLNACSENKKSGTAGTDNNEIAEQSMSEATNTLVMLEPEEYVQWIQNPENGFKKEKTIDDLIFTAQYKPNEYIICMEERAPQLQDSLVKRKLEELSELQYFDFKITLKAGEGELLKYKLSSSDEYNKRVNYFAFNMQNDIQLVEGNDTLPCSLFHFERAYDITPSSTFLLGFPVNKNSGKEDKTLIVYDKTFNKGFIKLTFSNNELKNLPKLKTL